MTDQINLYGLVESLRDLLALRPGDVVRVGEHIGVVAEAKAIVDGSVCNWDDIPTMRKGDVLPTYAIEWRTGSKLRHAWWYQSELDDVISLGPFHAEPTSPSATASEPSAAGRSD